MKKVFLALSCLLVVILNGIAKGNLSAEGENCKPPMRNEPSGPSVFVRDSTQYSAHFFEEVKRCFHDCKKISLINDSIIIDDNLTKTIKIPTSIPLNAEIEFSLTANSKQHSLKVRRINYSTIEYVYLEKTPDGIAVNLAGNADLNIEFYLSMQETPAEADNTNGMDEYADNASNGCWTYIGISMKNLEKSFIIQGCEEININSPEMTRFK
ncbi:MAG: hypothetical protein FWG22_01575 [Prolixibacteraceae bacterium]|nr:hypothetical protein [Prolixibacteraceae bacterium]